MGAPEAGEVHLFHRSYLGWVRGPVIYAPAGATRFGEAVSLSGSTLLIGAPDDDGEGRVYVYNRDPLVGWQLSATLTPQGLANTLRFGAAVNVKGPHAVVGAPDTALLLGNAVVYERHEGVWQDEAVLVPNLGPAEGRYGSAVAIDGEQCLVNVGLDDSGVIGYFGAIHVWLAAQEVLEIDPEPEPEPND